MLGFFPEIFPDELLFSALSRYSERVMYKSKEATTRDLFGNGRVHIAIDFQSFLGDLVALLPTGHRYSVDRLINDHTLLRFYGAFLPPARFQQLKRDIQEGCAGGVIHGRVGILTSKIRLHFLQFCPECAQADQEQYGEPYWHRLHQVPGVKVCPIHRVFLERSNVSVQHRSSQQAFVTLRQAVEPVNAKPIDPSNHNHQAHLQIARDAAWLLNQDITGTEQRILRGRYLSLLIDRDFASYKGLVKASKLRKEFQEYFSNDLLTELHCQLERRCNWLTRIVQTLRGAMHPVHHLLLMQFLGCPIEEFFRLPAEVEPFGKGPWPCLNPASIHYLEPRISTCKIWYYRHLGNRVFGKFSCDCGYVYRRTGPDKLSEDRYKHSGIISYGLVWHNRLIELYNSGNKDIKGLAQALGVSCSTINKKLAQLRALSSDSESIEVDSSQLAQMNNPKGFGPSSHLTINESRKQLLRAMKENPNAGRSELGDIVPTAYDRLMRDDREWMNANLPEARKPKGPKIMIDWKKRDIDLAAEIKVVVERLKSVPGRPVRISKSAIAKEMGQLGNIFKHPDRIPATIRSISEQCETIEDYAIRRIWWVVETYRQENRHLSMTLLKLRAAVSPKIAAIPKVKTALNDAFLNLATKSNP